MILYLDASSIVAIYLREAGRHDTVLELIEVADAVATSRISYSEARAGFALAAREPASRPRLARAAHDQAVINFNRDWLSFVRIVPSERLIHQAGDLAALRALKGYDAVQLASALELRARVPDTLDFSTWDRALARAAIAEGLSLAHEVNS